MLSALKRPTARVARLAAAPLHLSPLLVRNRSTVYHSDPPAHALNTRRHYATPPPQLVLSDLSEENYHFIADATLDRLLEALEEHIDARSEPGFEVDYSSGVLTLDLGAHGKYVINKQPPNKQIWLSSPVSGPKRYDLSRASGDWVYSRDARTLGALLDAELSAAFGEDVRLGLGAHVRDKVEERFGVHLAETP